MSSAAIDSDAVSGTVFPASDAVFSAIVPDVVSVSDFFIVPDAVSVSDSFIILDAVSVSGNVIVPGAGTFSDAVSGYASVTCPVTSGPVHTVSSPVSGRDSVRMFGEMPLPASVVTKTPTATAAAAAIPAIATMTALRFLPADSSLPLPAISASYAANMSFIRPSGGCSE